MVGVPALWEMLHRRIKTRLRERGDWIADLADNVIEFNAWIRDNTPFNLGPIVFFPDPSGNGRQDAVSDFGRLGIERKGAERSARPRVYGARRLRSDRIVAGADRCAAGQQIATRKRRQTAARRRGQDRQARTKTASARCWLAGRM